jgi:hypothetical protein
VAKPEIRTAHHVFSRRKRLSLYMISMALIIVSKNPMTGGKHYF